MDNQGVRYNALTQTDVQGWNVVYIRVKEKENKKFSSAPFTMPLAVQQTQRTAFHAIIISWIQNSSFTRLQGCKLFPIQTFAAFPIRLLFVLI
jgi:hypothetical protein